MRINSAQMQPEDTVICADDPILVTGATGFIGDRVLGALLDRGFRNVRCFGRPFSNFSKIEERIRCQSEAARIEIVKGNLLSREDCLRATRDVAVIYHLAAGTGTRHFSDAYMNSVVTTRNLLDATLQHKCLRRFVSVSSFAVYSNRDKPRWRLLDETCPMEKRPRLRSEAYSFAKVKQDELIADYGRKHGVRYALLRPGVVYGPGKHSITGRVGLGSFGIFLHLGGGNLIPFTYVDNCADAIVLAGLKKGVDGEIFNVVDDDLPSSRRFLRLYKKHVRRFVSVYVPHGVSYLFCCFWEKCSHWSKGQLPAAYHRLEWSVYWKRTLYTNEKLKNLLGWTPRVSTEEGLNRYFESCREKQRRA